MCEILAPAGNRECALAAINSGADAIYLGYSSFSARAFSDNFDLFALGEIIAYAHLFDVKVYVTMNTLVKECEREDFLKTLLAVHNAGADGILLQDIFLGKYVHERYPAVCLHLSTQAGANNVAGAALAKEYGFSRVVLARETAIGEIREIAKIIETEVFIQGALCSSFSGQCYFSSFVGGNSGNRGRCKQPCRRLYSLDGGEENYALSLADLCVGERVKELTDAGVYSLKIEGRMRRPEYVAAAVRYYRGLTGKSVRGGFNPGHALSDLKRTYNRGNYTAGLAFGQDRRFLSSAVQGHIGEKAGVVKVKNGQYFVECREKFRAGDGFKVLREGKEVGGGTFLKATERGFVLASRNRLKNGDGVFVTTDTALNERLLSAERKLPIVVTVVAEEGQPLRAACEGLDLSSDFCLQTAKSAPMSEANIAECFEKTDGLPFLPTVKVQTIGSVFAAKSQLNAFRREFYARLKEKKVARTIVTYEYREERLVPSPTQGKNNGLIAVMGTGFEGVCADIYIHKPTDYVALVEQKKALPDGENFLWLPPFLSEKEEKAVETLLERFDGIYAEGTYGIPLARRTGKKLFAGTGFNLSNRVAAGQKEFDYYVLSKELDGEEQRALADERAFVLSAGDLKLMDFVYCPFGKKCGGCEKKSVVSLQDESGRVFPLRRYETAAGCRFELYNCTSILAWQSFAGSLVDLSVCPPKKGEKLFAAWGDLQKMKEILQPVTSGHSKKSVL